VIRLDRLDPATGWPEVRALLEANGLPVLDLDRARLPDFIVARDGGQLVGCVAVERLGTEGLIRSLAVSEGRRGQGIGARLVEEAEALARRGGIGALYLLTTTAERFFAARGYQRLPRESAPASIGSTTEFTSVCPASAALMTKPLEGSAVAAPIRILILCTGNSARSQIAEALLKRRGEGRFEVVSAGTRPAARVNPWAVEILREAGIDWSGKLPRDVDGLERERWDFVITVCDRAREACPIFPGTPVLAHWGMPDPAEVEGSDDLKRRAFQDAYLLLNRRIGLLLALPLEKLDRLARESRLRQIGESR
jgi:protein-tyrosine-phosphatase/N-acetylglutamate synthase-like GNAT family acetyltransferase